MNKFKSLFARPVVRYIGLQLMVACLWLASGPRAAGSDNLDGIANPADLDPAPHYKKALALVKEEKYQESINELNKALELNPGYYEAKYELGTVYQIVGKPNRAKKLYEELLDHRPDYLPAHINLGSIYSQEKDTARAQEEFKKAIAINWYSLPAHYNLANMLVSQGQPQAALKEYKICLKLSPGNAMVHNNMGVLFDRRNYCREAIDEFRQAANLEPANKMFWQNLGLARQHLQAQLAQQKAKELSL